MNYKNRSEFSRHAKKMKLPRAINFNKYLTLSIWEKTARKLYKFREQKVWKLNEFVQKKLTLYQIPYVSVFYINFGEILEKPAQRPIFVAVSFFLKIWWTFGKIQLLSGIKSIGNIHDCVFQAKSMHLTIWKRHFFAKKIGKYRKQISNGYTLVKLCLYTHCADVYMCIKVLYDEIYIIYI